MKKLICLALAMATLLFFASCTVVHHHPRPARAHNVKVWVPGHFNHAGIWVPGHYRHRR